MNDGKSTKRHGGFKRRTLILDPEWQLAVFRNMAIVAVGAGLLQMLGTQALSSQDQLNRWSGEQIGYLSFIVNALFMGLMFLALWVVALRVTHSVVGPAMVIKKAVDGLAEGKFDSRLRLRKRDYLKSLASSVQVLNDQLKERDRLSDELVEALTQGDHGRALDLAQRMRDPRESAGVEDTKCAA